MNEIICPVCTSNKTELFKRVELHTYYTCTSCNVIFISPHVLEKMDKGEFLINYEGNYWKEELFAARERSWGTTLARVAEVFLYARLPIKKFVDIGSGPGYFLDAVNYQLPSSAGIFHAAELFPPDDELCTKNENFHKGSLLNMDFEFDAGCCIEVIEHLTPKMFDRLLSDLAKKSKNNSIYIFNTGLVEYIKFEDIGYLDPTTRGHVMGWSIEALEHIATPLGFNIIPIPGKSWAFLAEYFPDHNFDQPVCDRIWTALPENMQVLSDKQTGNLMYILGLETARAYT